MSPSFPTSCPFRVLLIHAPRPTRRYPRLWIWRPSSERQRDFNPPDLALPSTHYATVRLPARVHVGRAAIGLPRPARRTIAGGRWQDLPVPVQGVSTHAQGLRLSPLLCAARNRGGCASASRMPGTVRTELLGHVLMHVHYVPLLGLPLLLFISKPGRLLRNRPPIHLVGNKPPTVEPPNKRTLPARKPLRHTGHGAAHRPAPFAIPK